MPRHLVLMRTSVVAKDTAFVAANGSVKIGASGWGRVVIRLTMG